MNIEKMMKKILVSLVAIVAFSGCTGILTGHKYTTDEVVGVGKVLIKVHEGK